MAQIVTQPQALSLSYDISDITFSSQEEKGTLRLTLTAGGEEVTLLDEVLWTDSAGRVTVYGLPELVEPYVRRYGTATMRCTFDDGTGTVADTGTLRVLCCLADVGMPAERFTASHFLTTLTGVKLTAYGREERLYAYGTDGDAVTEVEVQSLVIQPDGTASVHTARLAATATTDGIAQFDVSPLNIIASCDLPDGRLAEYTVTAGERSQTFRTVYDAVAPEPSLVFTNSFGCEEFLHCTGTLKREGKFTRSSARTYGILRNYRIQEERLFTANTGWLSDDMADYAEELFRSLDVHLWTAGTRGKAVVLTESKSERTNEDDALTAYEFTYRYSQRTQDVIPVKSDARRIFTEQFNEMFN